MKRTITVLIITLITSSVLFGQNFKRDIKEGLYVWSPGFVIQQNSDSFKIVQLRVSKTHFLKAADVLYDSITKSKLLSTLEPLLDEIRPSDTYRIIKPSKIIDIVEFGKDRFSIIVPTDKGFNSVNFIKRDFGYEMYFSNHEVKSNRIKQSIKRDTVTYFKLYAFTLDDLRNLKALKNFDNMNPTETEALATAFQECAERNVKLFDRNKNFRMVFDDPMGIIGGRELLIKSLIEIRYCPLIDSNDPDFIFEKMKPFLKRKR
ncbi:MAG: hypothetical protein O9262_06340 [Cyclobacteriaceae bacterium]|nr:hypothetical protein [Cyclobacteriaceae bacterium]